MLTSASSAEAAIRRPLPNPWRWSSAATIKWQVAWAGGLALLLLMAAALLLPGGGQGGVTLSHIVFHELGHAMLAAVGDGTVHRVVVGMQDGHVLHKPTSDMHGAIITLAGVLAPAIIAGILLISGVTRLNLEILLVVVAACLAGTAQFAAVDGDAIRMGLYVMSIATLIVAFLPGLDLVKAAVCMGWSFVMILGLWWAASGLFANRPLTHPDDPVTPTDTQKLANLFDVSVADVAPWLIIAQAACVGLPALWAANWIRSYNDQF